MTPREFFEDVVKPNIVDFEANFGSIRHAFNAIAAVDALAANLYFWLVANKPAATSARGDIEFREELAKANPDFALLRDLAKAQKHYNLTRGQPSVTSAAQVSVESPGWGFSRWDETRWDSPPQVYVTLDNGEQRAVDYLVRSAAALMDAEMAKHGL